MSSYASPTPAGPVWVVDESGTIVFDSLEHHPAETLSWTLLSERTHKPHSLSHLGRLLMKQDVH